MNPLLILLVICVTFDTGKAFINHPGWPALPARRQGVVVASCSSSSSSSSSRTTSLWALYKPDGYLSQFVCSTLKRRQRLITELVEPYELPDGVMPIGRLDEMSEGLLLLTTDGSLSNFVTSSGAVEKEYFVQVDGVVTDTALEQLASGVSITDHRSSGSDDGSGQHLCRAPRAVRRLSDTELIATALPERRRRIRCSDAHGPTSWLSVTITEGKYRQVRRMTAAVGFPTLRLVRVRVGNIGVADMAPGEVRPVDCSAVRMGTLVCQGGVVGMGGLLGHVK